MKQKKNLFFASMLGLGLVSLGLASCSKNDNDGPAQNNGSDTLKGDISASRTLTTGKTYYISGAVFVTNKSTLTIQPGVVIKAIKGTKAVLVITKECKIDAQGTATQPIVFTSNQASGATGGIDNRKAGDWGGVVLVGRAKVNSKYPLTTGTPGRRILEGFDPAEITSYGDKIIGGGDIDDDNSGTMKYVRIEFPGIPLSATTNSELNGLTFLAVGNKTVIDHIQVSFSGDDSFEWFGGTVNATNLIAYKGVDDDFDTDNGYTGKVQFGLVIRDNAAFDISAGASNGFESDNEDPVVDPLSAPITNPVFSNVTFIGPGATTTAAINANFGRAGLLRRGSKISIYNSVFLGWSNGINIDGPNSNQFAVDGSMEFKNNIVAGFPTGQFIYSTNLGTAPNGAAAFLLPANNNDVSITDVANLKFGSLSAASIDARPITGSPLLGKASFSSAKLAGLTNVTYAGALNTGDTWHQGWTEFDPKNKAY